MEFTCNYENVTSSFVNDTCWLEDIWPQDIKKAYTQFKKHKFRGALSGLEQSLAIEAFLKMMKNAFYFTLKTLFALKIFKFLSWLFGHIEKRLD